MKPHIQLQTSTTVNSNQLELIKSAILAPSSHNTQPWKFHLEKKSISIFPDFSRRCPIVDPDDHHLFVSLGCAAENLVQAARARGQMTEALIDFDQNHKIEFHLSPTKSVQNSLSQAIAIRQCTRTEYNGQKLSSDEVRILTDAGSGNGVHCHMFTEKNSLEKILEFVVQGNTSQMNDPAFITELKTWIRFNNHEAKNSGDGLYSLTTGSPNIPTWLGKIIFKKVFKVKKENEKYCKHIRSSAGIAVFTSEKNDIKHWIEVGRCYERFALQATLMDIRSAMINQPVEVAKIRPVFANYLGIGKQRPDLVIRFGRGPIAPRSMRRKPQSILV
ncbi:MAG: Acg family FMN-binding oxidoreductase [Bacteriovoracaceae bacterium]